MNLPARGGGGGTWETVSVTASVNQPLITCIKNEALKLAIVWINTQAITANSFTIDISNAPAANDIGKMFCPMNKGGYMLVPNDVGGTLYYNQINVAEAHAWELGQLVYKLA